MNNTKEIILIGAGGHAKVVHEAACANGFSISGYNDPASSSWLTVPHLSDSECDGFLEQGTGFFIGMGGQTTESLQRRLRLFEKYSRISRSPKLVHPKACVCDGIKVHDGVLIGAGAIVQVATQIGTCSIINSGAIIEHDSIIGKGVHIAPGAIILGGAEIGDCSMIGSGAIILPSVRLPANSFVKALSIQREPS